MTASIPAEFRDLLEAPGTAILSTHHADGHIQSTALWYVLDGDNVRLSLSDARQKLKNLQRDPKVTLFLLDPSNPQRTLEIRATAEAEVDADGALAAQVGAKYGADLAAYDQPGDTRYVVTLVPDRVNAVDMSAGH
jgi:PPOX class probable F420-dependent enzyme